MPLVTLTCKECKKEFKVVPCRFDKAIYCSRKCMADAKRYKVKGGESFNRLTIIKETEPEIQYSRGKETKLRHVDCVCVCGGKINTRLVMVMNGDAKSCGCLKVEQNKLNLINNNQHPIVGDKSEGLGSHPLYSVWANMKGRCYNKKCVQYKYYGARGIIICNRWLNLVNFITDMYLTYSKGLEIERVNNDGNYELSNCIWATKTVQSVNKRNTMYILFKGNKIPFRNVCEMNNVNYHKMYRLIKINKVAFEDALKMYHATNFKCNKSSK